ncbi:nuclear transport factor 2 family protein [Pontibacter russatus]|uniref:nuclear transport factor 2 family protein n=1 Tax=Pontibacter russatus TaxID=2694929 RepID=UPI00137A71FD|nr:nuclear transport factor 2 family protein [Pontibacter russatus]
MTDQHPNLLLIHSFFKAYANNDLEEIRKILMPDIEWVIPGRHRLSGTKIGVEEVLGYFKQINSYSFKAQPIVMGVNDDYVIDCHLNWSNLEGGENIKAMSCLLWKFKDGKISKVYNFPEDQHMIDDFFDKV